MDRRFVSLLSTLLLVFIGYSQASSRGDGFVVTVPEPNLWPVEGDPFQNTAKFHYVITPWPPPCSECKPNNAQYVKYEQVEFTLRKHSDGGDTRSLCFVRYTQGKFDVETGKCNETEPRMAPYEDIIPNGMTFDLRGINYTLDNGRYSLLIQYGNPDIQEDVNVHVQVRPHNITSAVSPEKTLYDVGDKVTMTCRIKHCNPGAHFSWTRGVTEALVPVRDYVATSYGEESYSEIEVTLYKGDSGAIYSCQADNGVGQDVSTSFSPAVQYPPEIIVDPCKQVDMDYMIVQGHTARFTCHIDANPEYTQIKWFKGTSPIFDSKAEVIPGANETTLSVKDVHTDDRDVYYWCQATSSMATTQRSCKLDVHYPPIITLQPDTMTVQDGRPMEVLCTAEANPAVEHIQWKLVGDPSSNLGDDRLYIPKVEPEDAGEYECVAINNMVNGQYTQRQQIQVNVLFNARQQQYSLHKFGGAIGHETSLRCDLWAYPDLSFTWRFNDKVLGSDGGRTITDDGQASVLTIHAVSEGDYGSYECAATNSQSTQTFSLYLLKPGKPDKPQDCFPTDIAANDVSIQCILGYDGHAELNFYVERQDGKKRREVELTFSLPDTRTEVTAPCATVELHQLPPSTNHTLYVYQKNTHGRSEDMLTLHVKTQAGATVVPPIDRGPSVGAVVGVALAAITVIALMSILAVFVFWKFGDSSDVPYKDLTYGPIDKVTDGQENLAFRDSTVPNEYVMVPGMTKAHPRERGERDSATNDPRPRSYHEAVKLREGQTNLAGMGALSHNSTLRIDGSRDTPDQSRPEGARPKRMAPADPDWEFPRSRLTIQQKLGEGAYGEVWKGTARNLQGEAGATVVAVKFLRDNTPAEEHESLRRELEVMKQLKPHPNVISLLGCCSLNKPLNIIMEFAAYGNLQQYLRSSRASDQQNRYRDPESVTLTSRDLTVFALHVACGMEYIADKEFLHRDLAARNVLVDTSLTCKIGDFGLARDIINTRQYEGKTQRRLPIRWMAPESLFDFMYSSKSDVWSFGILLWEVVTLGSTPYPGLTGQDIIELLRTGYRMDKPRLCSKHMYSLMRDCWNDSPRQRPSFPLLRKQLENQLWELEQHSGSILSVQQMAENMFAILQDQPGEKC